MRGLIFAFNPKHLISNLGTINSYVVVISLTILGALCRLPALDSGLWRDEASTYFNTVPSSLKAVIDRIIYSELNPPAFFLMIKSWGQIFGMSEVALKLPSFILGVSLIPTIYFLGRIAFSRRAGLIAAFFAAFHPEAIKMSQEARPYTASILLGCLLLISYLCVLFEEKYKKRALLLFSLTALLFFYTQYTGLVFILILTVSTFFFQFHKQIKNREAILIYLSAFVAIALFLPWLGEFIGHYRTGLPWIDKPSLLQKIKIPYDFFISSISVRRFSHFSKLFNLLFLSFLVLESISFFKGIKYGFKGAFHLARSILFFDLVLVASVFSVLGYRTERYYFPFYTIVWCLCGLWIEQLFTFLKTKLSSLDRNTIFRYSLRTAIVLLILSVCYSSLIYGINLGNSSKSGIRLVAQDFLRDRADLSRTFVALAPDYLAPTFGYYFRNSSVTFRGFGRWNNPEIFSPQNYAKVWSSETLVQDFLNNLKSEINSGRFDRFYLLVKTAIEIKDEGEMRYSRVNDLLVELKRKYRLIEGPAYLGVDEPIKMYEIVPVQIP